MQFIRSSCKVSTFQGFFGRFSQSVGNGAGFLQLGKLRSFGTVLESLKENELDKLKKFTLNEHFIQTFVNYHPFSDIVLWYCTLNVCT